MRQSIKAPNVRFYCILFFCCTNAVLCYSQAYTLEAPEVAQPMTVLDQELIQVFEDSTGRLAFEEVSKPALMHQYLPLSQGIQYDQNSSLWMKFSIKNPLPDTQKLILYLNDWDVSVWAMANGVSTHLGQYGIMAPYHKPEYHVGETALSYVMIEIAPEQEVTYYVKTPGFLKRSSLFVIVQPGIYLHNKVKKDLIILGIYSGGLIIAFLVNLFLLIRSPRWRNVYYALNCISYFIFFTGYHHLDAIIPLKLPISHTIFLPIATIFYLLFVYDFLQLGRSNRLLAGLFKGYAFLLSIVTILLFYFYFTHSPNYYFILTKTNPANFYFSIFSLIAVIKAHGKHKYFIAAGLFFLFSGYALYWYNMSLGIERISFLYPMAGNMLEMVTFLYGNYYLLSQESREALTWLSEKENELSKKKDQLFRFLTIIREKNLVIEEFTKRLDHRDRANDQKLAHIQQLSQTIILTDEDWAAFKRIFEEVYENFFIKIKSRQPDLTESEIRLAALTKLNLSTKEMANILGISPESINKSRYRLRKKLSESGEVSLEELVKMTQ